MKQLDIVADLIGDWAHARNLVEGATLKDQLTKLTVCSSRTPNNGP
jgi:hypothetical protein